MAADLDAVKRIVVGKIAAACSDLEPDYSYAVTTETLDASKGNYRPVSLNRHDTFKTTNAYGGYGRSLYPIVWFDSRPARETANILEGDDSIEVWVRLQIGDTPIPWRGRKYQPDFLVITKAGKHYMIEVKADSALDTNEVTAKHAAALIWANRVADAGLGDWTYLLIPESAVEKSKLLRHLVTSSRKP